jgi:hypothetical protein
MKDSPTGIPAGPVCPGMFTTGTCRTVHMPLNDASPVESTPTGASPVELGARMTSYWAAMSSIWARQRSASL